MKSFIKNILSTTLALIISLVLIFSVFIFVISSGLSKNEKNISVSENSILFFNLSKANIVERKSTNPLEILNNSGKIVKTIELKQILDNIEKAKNDNSIKGIYINVSAINAGISQIEEIRNKLINFKISGKKVIAYSETYSQNAYYLVSVADKIYLNPEGIIELKGLSATTLFYKGLLEKISVDVQIVRHGNFKSAIEPFTLKQMSNENRMQLSAMLNSLSKNMFNNIALERNISLDQINKNANKLELNSAKKCLNLSYVDAIIYEDQVYDTLKTISENQKLNLIDINQYSNINKNINKNTSRNKIAIIYANGTIQNGEGDENKIGSTTTVKAIKKAANDKNTKAIVLRINSGGGSALASDVIWRELKLIKNIKPIVVSMGDYAASGGYYIACVADKIVANPNTITGSIGVFGMIPNMQDFYKNKLGVTIDTVNTHKYADIGINRPLSSYERKKIKENIKNVYNTFVNKVASGRQKSVEYINEVAQGKIWSGLHAKNIGLIDTIGGIENAIEIAANLANIKDFRVISLPIKKDPLTQLALEISNDTHFKKIVLNKIGFQSNLTNPIEDLIFNDDMIQTRIPFIIKLK